MADSKYQMVDFQEMLDSVSNKYIRLEGIHFSMDTLTGIFHQAILNYQRWTPEAKHPEKIEKDWWIRVVKSNGTIPHCLASP